MGAPRRDSNPPHKQTEQTKQADKAHPFRLRRLSIQWQLVFEPSHRALNRHVYPILTDACETKLSRIEDAISALPERNQRRMLGLYLGLWDGAPRTREELAERFGMSRRQVGQLLNEGIAIVRQRLAAPCADT